MDVIGFYSAANDNNLIDTGFEVTLDCYNGTWVVMWYDGLARDPEERSESEYFDCHSDACDRFEQIARKRHERRTLKGWSG